MSPDSTAFRALDLVADSFNPLLALFALAAPLLRRLSRPWQAIARYYVVLGVGVAVVYLVGAADARLGLWTNAGLDYSTHSAFAASVAASACFWHRRWLGPLLVATCAYAVLVLLLGFHGLAEILSAALVGITATAAAHVLIAGRPPEPDARRSWWPLLLPAAYLLHLAEEWWGGEGFASWTARALGQEVGPTRFLVLNGIVWPLFAVLTVAAVRRPALAWFLTTFSTVVVVNALLHALGSLASASYSPGLLTGLLLYLPVGTYALVSGSRELPQRAFARAALAGLLIHALVAVIAFA